ncbi:hypothetical protein [Paraburkholderia fynbosensis]|uniref:Uncharacterized protein n=1 Tax=Paraburkholderia fynbosensis TaxID=1200993 RepID=A0A6J5G0N3_9BURK|nr:hypothetical protein [Paraburkholderia fynbosensis]CAB3790946.1 hypothetical protein LMG27177_02954 [Paraburkholderia fynbosensis]
MTRRIALVLAVVATTTTLSLSVLAGWQRGGLLQERLAWVAIGLVLVTSAHLLPALLRESSFLVRVTGSALWGACLMTACIGHTVFFVTSQQHAGDLRVLAVPTVPVQTSGRSLTNVMAERAVATAQLATVNARYCTGICTTLEARRTSLAARVDALNAEADDIRRQHATDDRVTARRDALRADPVTSRLAALLGVSASRIDLLFGSLFAAVLEGVACLLWAVALRPSSLPVAMGARTPEVATVRGSFDTTPPTITSVANASHPAVTPVTVSHPDGTHSRETLATSPPPSASDLIDNHLKQLVRDIANGLVRPTVADIRRHLGCSQAKAVALRRQIGPLKS